MWLLALLACDPPEEGPLPVCEQPGDTVIGVLSTLTFARATEEGVSSGFDLDGAVTESGGATGCGIADYTSPDGAPGIDNGFAVVVPTLELTEASAVEGLIQDAINNGNLLILFELSGVDSTEEDPCVDVTLLRGQGTPSIATNGELEWSQTFDRDLESPSDFVAGASITGSRLVAGPIDLLLPVQILNADLTFPISNGYLQIDFLEDGSFKGVMGGAVSTDYIIEVARTENVDQTLGDIVEALMDSTADLSPDEAGQCRDISVTLEFDAVPAFFFADSPPADTGADTGDTAGG